MPSLSDSIFLFILALLLFGPKKLPVLARELGKWVGEFRRASNEFKMQMEEELRVSEQEDRRKQIAAMEAAAPPAIPVDEPEHPHLQPLETAGLPAPAEDAVPAEALPGETVTTTEPYPAPEPLPIATSGDLRMMPPATGLPVARGRSAAFADPARSDPEPSAASNSLDSFVSSIPHRDDDATTGHLNGTENIESAAHGH